MSTNILYHGFGIHGYVISALNFTVGPSILLGLAGWRRFRKNWAAIPSWPKVKARSAWTSLETITREDVSSFIEHEQDRGMQPNTVSTRLRLIYAFLRYLVDREMAHPDLLKR